MKFDDHGMWLRIGFGLFFLIFGLDRIFRTNMWANEAMLGSFYGSMGTITALVMVVGIIQVLIALSFFANFKTNITSIIALVMVGASLIVTIVPLLTYVFTGGTAIPAILFADHFPLLAGAWAINRHYK